MSDIIRSPTAGPARDSGTHDDGAAAPAPAPAAAEARRPPYVSYMHEIYTRGVLTGERPPLTTDPSKLQAAARAAMQPEAYHYIAGGAGEGATMDANRLAFRQWKVVPRMLRPTAPRDLSVTLFGCRYDSPLVCAPVGAQSLYHRDGDAGTARACADLGVPFTMSTASSATLQDVAAACGATQSRGSGGGGGDGDGDGDGDSNYGGRWEGGGHRWFQLYWPSDDAVTASILRAARAAGFSVLVVTLDTPTTGWRPADLDAAYLPFLRGHGNAVGLSDPAMRERTARAAGLTAETGGGRGGGEIPPLLAAREWLAVAFSGDARPARDLRLLRRHWDGPIVLKGVLRAADAVEALGVLDVETRRPVVDGLVVSNHGGRQVDGAVAALDMLPEVVEAVRKLSGGGSSGGGGVGGGGGDRQASAPVPVLFDSGVRTGADAVKALALGARAVLVGRPLMYGLGARGGDGVRHVLACLLADLDNTMGLAGIKSVGEIGPDTIRRVVYPGDVRANL